MGWGTYGIAEAEYSSNGQAAVCVFTLYNKRRYRKKLTDLPNRPHSVEESTF